MAKFGRGRQRPGEAQEVARPTTTTSPRIVISKVVSGSGRRFSFSALARRVIAPGRVGFGYGKRE